MEETRSGWIPLGSTIIKIDVQMEKTYEHVFKNEKVPEFVVPEVPYGTILSLLAMILGLAITRKMQNIPY